MKISTTTLRKLGNSYYILVGKKITREIKKLEGDEMIILWEGGERAKIIVMDVDTFKREFKDTFEWG